MVSGTMNRSRHGIVLVRLGVLLACVDSVYCLCLMCNVFLRLCVVVIMFILLMSDVQCVECCSC